MFQENDIIYNRYRLLESFGRGGFSIVWKALDERTGMTVALKVFMKQDKDGIELCRQEFIKAHDLIHPYIVRPMFFDEYQGAPFLVLPFYEKGTAISQIGQLGERETANFMHQIGSALHYLHSRTNAILHNDIKPDNFLVSDEGEYHLSDFGISDQLQIKLTQTIGGYFAAEASSHRPGMTPIAYRAPELFPLKNHPKQEPSPASDIWAFGASLYQMVKGDAPFSGQGGLTQRIGMTSGNATLTDLLEELPSHIPPSLQGWILACLALDPTARPAARQLQQAAEHFQGAGFWPAPPIMEPASYPTQKVTQPYPPDQVPNPTPFMANRPAYTAPPPTRRMMVPIWVWGLATLLACTGAFAIYKTNLDKTCTGLLADADSYFLKQEYEKAKAMYLEAKACDPFVADDLPGRIRRAEVLGKIKSYPASQPPSEGLVAVGDTIMDKFRWGYLDTANGALKIHLRYDSVGPFSDGVARVWKNGKAMTIDHNGQVKIGEDFTEKGGAGIAEINPTANAQTTGLEESAPQYRPVGKVDFSLSEATVYTGTSIRFTDQSSPQGNVALRIWEFGDGATANTKKNIVNHSYRSPGSFEVRLCVNEGRPCATKKVTVIADRPELDRNGAAGYEESLRHRCLADQGDPAWKMGDATVTLKPKTVVELQNAVLYADVGGKVRITLSGGRTPAASVTRYVNRGRSLVNLDDLGVTLEAGNTYTMTITPLKDEKGNAPRLENAAACAKGDSSSGQLGVSYGGDGVLFKLAYLY